MSLALSEALVQRSPTTETSKLIASLAHLTSQKWLEPLLRPTFRCTSNAPSGGVLKANNIPPPCSVAQPSSIRAPSGLPSSGACPHDFSANSTCSNIIGSTANGASHSSSCTTTSGSIPSTQNLTGSPSRLHKRQIFLVDGTLTFTRYACSCKMTERSCRLRHSRTFLRYVEFGW